MKHILVTRIDDRLIHGQVVTAWIKQYPINKILIIDDELSRNKLMERIRQELDNGTFASFRQEYSEKLARRI